MFDSCTSLISIDLSKFNTSKVTNMGFMFYECSSLVSADISNFDTSKVTDMSDMFYGCSSLVSINPSINNKKTSSSISIGVIIGIIAGGVVIVIAITIIICCCRGPCKNYFPKQNNKEMTIKHIHIKNQNNYSNKTTSFNGINNSNLIEYKPSEDKTNPFIVIFENACIDKKKILVDSSDTIEELIKFYFEVIGKSYLYGDPIINFLISAKTFTPPYSKDIIGTLKNKMLILKQLE